MDPFHVSQLKLNPLYHSADGALRPNLPNCSRCMASEAAFVLHSGRCETPFQHFLCGNCKRIADLEPRFPRPGKRMDPVKLVTGKDGVVGIDIATSTDSMCPLVEHIDVDVEQNNNNINNADPKSKIEPFDGIGIEGDSSDHQPGLGAKLVRWVRYCYHALTHLVAPNHTDPITRFLASLMAVFIFVLLALTVILVLCFASETCVIPRGTRLNRRQSAADK